MKSHFHRILLYATLYLIVVSHLAVSQPFGKIVGTIRDARTGELLLGETIVSLNPSGLGAMVDQKGSYVISQVPPGVYSICTVTFGYDFDTLFSIKLLPIHSIPSTSIYFALAPDELVRILPREKFKSPFSALPLELYLKTSKISCHRNTDSQRITMTSRTLFLMATTKQFTNI